MSYFLPDTPPLVVRENGGTYGYSKKVLLNKELNSSYGSLFNFSVSSKDWKKISPTERFINVAIPEINDLIKKRGLVVVYLFESGKTVSLPFLYYQGKRVVSFEPSYEIGGVCINLSGDFILNPHTSYTFRIVLVKNKTLKRYETVNWLNFEKALKALNLKKD